jgi:membrane-associated protein
MDGVVELLRQFVELLKMFFQLDEYLRVFVQDYGHWVYLGLFGVIFAETGLVVTPFLPGDSLLFAAGALAGDAILDVRILLPLLMAAAIIGDSLNYLVGSKLGRGLAERHPRLIKQRYLEETEGFYAKHGGKTVVLARFLPIIRTFAPFVAGVSRMPYLRFLSFSIGGTIIWVSLMVGAGYFFGGLPWVQEHFEIVVVAIIGVSLIPAVVQALRARRASAPETGPHGPA